MRIAFLVLVNLWIYPLLAAWTLVGAIIFFPALLLARLLTGWSVEKIVHCCVWVYARGCNGIIRPFVPVRCEGLTRENLPCPGIFVLNHYSFLDTYLMGHLPVFDAYIGLRAWPFHMPWYHVVMRLGGYLNLEDNSWDTIRDDAAKVFDKGSYLIMFPEGHRSRTGQMRRFYSGAFKLAVENNVPIIPICITGTQYALPPHRWWFEPAEVKFCVLKPVDPGAYSGENAHIELRKHVRQLMGKAVDLMEAPKR